MRSAGSMPDYARVMPEGDSLHRAARRLQVLVGQRVEVETPHPRAAGEAARRAARRPHARVGRGGRQEPAAPLRGRPRAAQPPADDRPLARRAARRARARAGRGSSCAATSTRRCSGTGRCSSSRRDARAVAARPGHPREPPDFDAMLARLARASRRRARSATRCSTSGSSPGSGTCGRRRRSGTRASRRGGRSPTSPTTSCAPRSTPRTRLMRGRRRRRARRCTASTAAPAAPCRRCGAAIRSYPQGDAARIAYWCPGCQRGGSAAGGVEGRVDARAASLRHAPPLLPRRVRRFTASSTTAPISRSPSRSTARTGGRRSTSTARSCAASSRRAPTGSSRATTCATRVADLQREPAARDLRPRPRRATRRRGARALPQRARAAARAHRRGLRRLRLGRRAPSTARTRSSRSRSSARATRTARSRRSSASPCGTQIELGDGIRVRAAATGELAAMWPEAHGLLPRDFGREPDRLCVLELERSLERARARRPTRPASSPTPSPRSGSRPPRPSPPGRCSSSGSTGGRTASARCCRSRRPRRPASRRGSTRSAPRSRATLRPRLALADDDAQLGDALDRWELSLFQDEPFRGEQLRMRSTPRSATATALWAAGDARCRPARRDRGGARRPRRALPRADAATSLRRLLVAVLLHGDRRALLRELDERAARRCARRSRTRRSSCAQADTASRRLRVEAWRRRAPCWPGSSASRRSSATRADPRSLLAELRELVREAETWARRERDPAAIAAAERLAERATVGV